MKQTRTWIKWAGIPLGAGGIGGPWIAGPMYGLVWDGMLIAVVVLGAVLVVVLPDERSNRLFRMGRLLLNRGEHPAPPISRR